MYCKHFIDIRIHVRNTTNQGWLGAAAPSRSVREGGQRSSAGVIWIRVLVVCFAIANQSQP